MSTPVTVVGATGKLGRHVVARLQARGVPVIPVVRSPEKLEPALRAEARCFDREQPATYPAALAGTRILSPACMAAMGRACWRLSRRASSVLC